MSNVKHIACPRCQANGRDRHGDNLAIYPDGSSYCFSCGYTENRNRVFVKQNKQHSVELPRDLTWEIPIEAQKWLYKYLTREDIVKYRISWSPYWEQIIIPIGLNGYISRNFSKDKPKWYFRGIKPTDYILRTQDSDTVVLCEDIISGIKIHRAGYNAHVLFGTNIPMEGSRKLYNQFSSLGVGKGIGQGPRVRVWLDQDAQKKSLRSVLRLQTFFKDVRTISTQHDPKEYDIDQVREIVNAK